MQNACVAIIQVRDVPDDVRDVLARRARAAGQSLQQYLRNQLIRQARHPTPAEFWDRVAEQVQADGSSYDLSEAVEDVRAMREGDR